LILRLIINKKQDKPLPFFWEEEGVCWGFGANKNTGRFYTPGVAVKRKALLRQWTWQVCK
jgi:hypothetical protein